LEERIEEIIAPGERRSKKSNASAPWQDEEFEDAFGEEDHNADHVHHDDHEHDDAPHDEHGHEFEGDDEDDDKNFGRGHKSYGAESA
jgi:hypothetical protein